MRLVFAFVVLLVAGLAVSCSPFDVESQVYGCTADADCVAGFVCDQSQVPSRCVAEGSTMDTISDTDASDVADASDQADQTDSADMMLACTPECDPLELCCDGTCTVNDELNCGTCGNSCEPGFLCASGACQPPGGCGPNFDVCAPGQRCCNDMCVVQDDPSCTCNAPEDCGAAENCCDNQCVAASSIDHCQSCGNSCRADETCSDQGCVPSIPCNDDFDCDAQQYCDARNDICRPYCSDGSTCAMDEVCDGDRRCHIACTSSSECQPGDVCIEARGLCSDPAKRCWSGPDCFDYFANTICTAGNTCECDTGFLDVNGDFADGCELLAMPEDCNNTVDDDGNMLADCEDPACNTTCGQVVFFTQSQFPGDFAAGMVDPVQFADTQCIAAATEAGSLTASISNGSWRAIISYLDSGGTSFDARGRLVFGTEGVFLPDGSDFVPRGTTDVRDHFWENRSNRAVNLDQYGNMANAMDLVWTGSGGGGGASGNDCNQFRDASSNGTVGRPTATGFDWLTAQQSVCTANLGFYCINGQ